MTSKNKINQIKVKLQKLNQKNTKTALEIVQELFNGLAGADLNKQTIQQYTDTLFKFWHKSVKDYEAAEAFKIIQNWFADKENYRGWNCWNSKLIKRVRSKYSFWFIWVQTIGDPSRREY